MQIKFKTGPCAIILVVLLFTAITGCKKTAEPEKIIETGVVSDNEGNVYKTVKIGNQWWMAEDLKTIHYNNGTLIKDINNDKQWADETGGAVYSVRGAEAGTVITKILRCYYNWRTVIDSNKIAPSGWHIPTDGDWKELEKHLGMSQNEVDKTNFRGTNEGDKLKITGGTNWQKYTDDVRATNESGFSATAKGCIMFDGTMGQPNIKFAGFWWSATPNQDSTAWYRHLDYKKSNVFRFYGSKKYGFSIRCVKD